MGFPCRSVCTISVSGDADDMAFIGLSLRADWFISRISSVRDDARQYDRPPLSNWLKTSLLKWTDYYEPMSIYCHHVTPVVVR